MQWNQDVQAIWKLSTKTWHWLLSGKFQTFNRKSHCPYLGQDSKSNIHVSLKVNIQFFFSKAINQLYPPQDGPWDQCLPVREWNEADDEERGCELQCNILQPIRKLWNHNGTWARGVLNWGKEAKIYYPITLSWDENWSCPKIVALIKVMFLGRWLSSAKFSSQRGSQLRAVIFQHSEAKKWGPDPGKAGGQQITGI